MGSDGQKGVGRNHAFRTGDDAEAVVVRVIGQDEVIVCGLAGDGRHDIGRRAVHADLAVVVVIHEGELRVIRIVDEIQVQVIRVGNLVPVVHARPAQGVDQDAQFSVADGVHVDDGVQFGHVESFVIVRDDEAAVLGLVIGHHLDAFVVAGQETVGFRFDGLGDIRASRAAGDGIVLDTAVFRRIVGRRNDQAVSQAVFTMAVIAQDGPRDRRCRHEIANAVDVGRDTVGCQDGQDRFISQFRQIMGIFADEQRPFGAELLAEVADSLGNGRHVVLSKAAVAGLAAMA